MAPSLRIGNQLPRGRMIVINSLPAKSLFGEDVVSRPIRAGVYQVIQSIAAVGIGVERKAQKGKLELDPEGYARSS